MEEKQRKALSEDIKAYQKLAKIKDSEEFKTYFETQLDILVKKLIWAFTTGKDGDNVKNWEDFCRVRGEIVARLQPIQDVYGAEDMVSYLNTQLKQLYNIDN